MATKDSKTFYLLDNGTKLYIGEQLLTDHGNVETLQTALANLTAAQVQYKAAQGTPGDEGYVAAQSVKAALDALNAAIGEGGSVDTQIAAAIADLDATVSQSAGADGLALSVTEVDGVITAVSGSIAANTYDAYGSAAAVLGDDQDTASDVTVYGAIAKADAANDAADAAQDDVDALETLVGTLPSGITATTVVGYIDEAAAAAQAAATYDDTALAARVSANEDAITLLNKTDGTAGSVKKTVDDAIAAVVASAPEDFDTLKEMSDWIAGHEDDASAMNSAIQANTSAIGSASVPAQGEPGDPDYVPPVAATGLHKKIEDETARATTAEGGLATRVSALEAQAGTGSVAEQISTAIGALDTSSDVTIASKNSSTNVVTIVSGISESDGVIAAGSGTAIDLAPIAATGNASDSNVADSGNYFVGTDVETVLAEIGAKLSWQAIS